MRHPFVSTAVLLLAALLIGCGGGKDSSAPTATAASGPTPSAGQVAPLGAAAKVSYYAASRFAEQTTFGPTPALVAEIQAKGYSQWIDDQFALPLALIDIRPAEAVYAYGFNDPIPQELHDYIFRELTKRAIAGNDQLRLRVMWSLSQFVVAAKTKGELPGWVTWVNLLTRHAFGNYRGLLRDASTDSHMGHYLDNDQNRPKSDECQHCAPNENYARELMQLFSIGVVQLDPEGRAKRDSRGRFVETYTQRDVEELARVLTGWTRDYSGAERPQRNWGNWGKPMIPSTWPPERDAGRKVVLGKEFPAGQTTTKDLDDAITMLMDHPNIAPFVGLRLIQHLVKSDPSPAYVGRVAATFRNNGRGVAGDMKAVVKAVLLDAEARRGDSPSGSTSADGKFREPFLHNMATWRGLGCSVLPLTGWGGLPLSGNQLPFNPESVFSFYAPTDRAPGSNLLAPEQRLLTADEIRNRISFMEWTTLWDPGTRTRSYTNLTTAGCQLDLWRAAFARSPRAFNDLMSARFFRGAMPPTLRSNIEQIMNQPYPPWNKDDPAEGMLRMIGLALATPYFGVSK